MGKMYGWLDRHRKESAKSYENRINHYPPQHAGYLFFDRINYDAARHVFSVFAVWNGELNDKLQDALPQGGYEIHCSRQDAEAFCAENCGIPVFVRLFSKAGALYARELFLRYGGKNFLVTFTGCEVIPLQLVCFRSFCDMAEGEEEGNRLYQGSGFPLRVLRAENIPSLPGSRHLSGSFRHRGSYTVMQYSGSGYRLAGSFSAGSGQLGLTYRGSGITGSFLKGSGRALSGSRGRSGGFAFPGSTGMCLPDENWSAEYWMEIFGIGCLGYGLNLI